MRARYALRHAAEISQYIFIPIPRPMREKKRTRRSGGCVGLCAERGD